MTYVPIRDMYMSIAENDGRVIAHAWRRTFSLSVKQVSIEEASVARDAIYRAMGPPIIPAGGRTNSRSDEGKLIFPEPILAH